MPKVKRNTRQGKSRPAASPPARAAAPPPRRRRPLLVFAIKATVLLALVVAVILMGLYVWSLQFDLSKIRDMPQRSTIYDKDGNVYSRLSGENRIVVPFDKVSPNFVNALISREDSRFYYHHGVDPVGILRAIARDIFYHSYKQGASTITQQLARNSFPLGGKNMMRKLVEAVLAFRIETELTKEEILDAYMNRIYFGSGCFGIETASQTYFAKPASDLDLAEAATLAGLIRSPSRFSPFANPDAALRERNTVLSRMHEEGIITEDEAQQATNESLKLNPAPQIAPQENWAMDAIQREMELVIDNSQLGEGGLQIYTTIDGALQKVAETAVQHRLVQVEATHGYPHEPMAWFDTTNPSAGDYTPYLEAAAIAIDSATGGIRAIVGGRDYDKSKFNRALLGMRQIGSAVKPFVYARAFESGLKPDDLVDDGKILRSEIPKKFGAYSPENSDRTYKGMQPAEEGLIDSRNTMTIRIGLRAGIDSIADTIIRLGLAPNPPRFPSLCLGAFETDLKDLTASYSVFANGGYKLQPFLIDHIADADGKVIYKATHGRLSVLTPGAAQETTSIMEQVIERGTAARARDMGLKGWAAGKTGTTNNFADAWFVGFNHSLTCGVWVGFDKPVTIMPGGYGATLALPIWIDIINTGQ